MNKMDKWKQSSIELMTMYSEALHKIFMYETLFGELPTIYSGVDVLESFKEYTENTKQRDEFNLFLEKKVAEFAKLMEVDK